jgi:heme-degrading monooxygenase HmoA
MQQSPTPPYYAVIFTSTLADDLDGYGEMADRMEELAGQQPGYIGLDSAREGSSGVTISYWRDEKSIAAWKRNLEHLTAQETGRQRWYKSYRVQVAKVERSY